MRDIRDFPNSHCSTLHTLMQLLFSFDQDMRVEKTLIQTLACQLSSTLMQLLFSFDQDMRVEKTLIQTPACQLSSTLMQLLFSFDQDMRVEKTFIQTLACQLSSNLMQLLFSFDQDMRVEKTLIQTLACQLSQTLIVDQEMREKSHTSSHFKTVVFVMIRNEENSHAIFRVSSFFLIRQACDKSLKIGTFVKQK